MTEKLETKRLILRPWRDEDAEELYQYAKDPRVGPAAGWPVHSSAEDSRKIIRGILSWPETYAIVLKESGKPVGSISIKTQRQGAAPMSETEAELGYWIGVPYWGQGLMPEAVRYILRRCFDYLGCTGVWCGYFNGNTKSRRVQEKCGFTYHHTEVTNSTVTNEKRTEHFSFLSRADWLKDQHMLETERLELVPLPAYELSLLIDDLPLLEQELNCSYQAEPICGSFRNILQGQRFFVENDPADFFWNSFWLIIRLSDRVVIGSADFKHFPDEKGETEIGYGLGKAFEHNGYMTETIQSMCSWALNQSELHAVIAETERDNLASQHVLQRCGFSEYKSGNTLWWRLEKQGTD